jgi:hypothetical protein
LPFGIPGKNSGSLQNEVNPGDEAQSPIRCIKTDDAGADVGEMDGPCQPWVCKRSIMDKGREKAARRWGDLNLDRGRYAPDSPIIRGVDALAGSMLDRLHRDHGVSKPGGVRSH